LRVIIRNESSRVVLVLISSSSKFDVVVIGAGVVGMASAYYIKKGSPGKNVLVLERYADVGQGNTARSNAMFRNTFTSPDNQVLAGSSIDFYLHVQRELGVDIGIDLIGYLWMMSPRQRAGCERHVKRMQENGVELKIYERAELAKSIPGLVTKFNGSEEAGLMKLEDIDAAVLGRKCGRLAPDNLTSFYRDQFLKLGGKISFNTEAGRLVFEAVDGLGIQGEPFAWQDSRVAGVKLGDGRVVKADRVVVAAGAWNSELLDGSGIDGHVKNKKRQTFGLSAKGNSSLEKLLLAKGFNDSGTLPFTILPKSGLYIKPVKEEGEFLVACEDEINRPFITVPEHDLEKYQAELDYYEMSIYHVLREYLPQFEGVRPTRMWAGLYSYNTIDNMPYVFEEDGVIAVGGDSGSGVMKGDAMGRVVEAVYREGNDATAELYGGKRYQASRLGFKSRDVEREEWVI
jgi:FAD-dependent oxidoreductase domain-containing protein 1